MTTTPNPAAPGTPGKPPPSGSSSAWAAGGVLFAAVLMMINGVFAIFEGIAALAKDDVLFRVRDYSFRFDLTSWGWIHLILGIVVLIVGIAILKGTTWGRAVGIALTGVMIILHFLWLPYQPFWSLIAIAIGVFVIWALCTDRSPGAL
ncbi:hypothetical protein ACFXKW_10665 [Streptomyces sp. NPDC059193]|uniref:DUF7144 family membrane protein n=1 Tax=Streptomyces sp. NPDC059193 TaxID=3346763 RepID=UPI0036AE2405